LHRGLQGEALLAAMGKTVQLVVEAMGNPGRRLNKTTRTKQKSHAHIALCIVP
jgi:hypothetical protein